MTTTGSDNGWKHVRANGAVYIANAGQGLYWCTRERCVEGVKYHVRFGAVRRLAVEPKRGTVAAGIRMALAAEDYLYV